MIYQFVNKWAEILPLATSHISHLYNLLNHVFALLFSMPDFQNNNFDQK